MMKLRFPWIVRLITAAALCIFIWRSGHVWLGAPTLTLTLLILGEIVTMAIYLAARPSQGTRITFVSLLSTLVATFFFLFVFLDEGQVLAPLWITSSLQATAILWQIASKMALGRSFGLLPANRGIVTRGPYRWVRHPIYLGYFAGHMAFLAASFSWRNFWLFAAVYFFQALRIREEEKLLMNDASYCEYAQRVRYRMFPGLI